MAKCECLQRIESGMKETHGIDGKIDYELLSGKTYSTLRYKEITKNGKEKEKHVQVFHSYCPFCGKKFE